MRLSMLRCWDFWKSLWEQLSVPPQPIADINQLLLLKVEIRQFSFSNRFFLFQRNAGRKSFPVTDWFWLRGRRSLNRCFLAKHFRKVKTEKSSLTTFRTVISTLSKVLDMQKFKQKFTNYAVIIEDISFTKLKIQDIHFD